ncbi:MAG: universal stress protein [Marinilabiliaceae bacterium]|nr:universal stress protein [Marinilabiliaceae bacterium]
MKRVLVPVDFSEASISALEFGLELANRLKADLRVMHVNTGKNYAPKFDSDNVDLRINDQIDHWMLKLKEEYVVRYKVTGGDFDIKIREGNITKEICNQAKYDDTSLIVLGAHGVSGFEDKWIGSNAYRLVANAPCPVLLVRKNMVWKEFRKIVLPVGIKKESRLKVPVVAGLAKLFNAKVYVVGMRDTRITSILNSVKAVIKQVQRYIESNAKLETEFEVLTGSGLANRLLEYSNSIDADLISVQVHHDSNPFSDFFRPFANDVINNATRPVLVVPTRE